MRFLHTAGYGKVVNDPAQIQLAFPAALVAKELAEGGCSLTNAEVRHPAQPVSKEVEDFWTILGDQSLDSLENVARNIALEGLELAMPSVPVRRFGKLVTIERREIEALNCISNLISEYSKQPRNKPLSIAVFGPPGAGKSFAVKEVANSVRPNDIKVLTFNLSQFSGLDDLIDAFHQVRDAALSGKLPLVFWDEFDSSSQNQPLVWLHHFLAPMQDGEFQEGQITHPIGQSIFVFAGGTSYCMEDFGAGLADIQQKAAKLPDFISRLKGFLNILGPNPIQRGGKEDRDPYYVIRRAILLRSILERQVPQIFYQDRGKLLANIDDGVLRAFLSVKEYKHGARSMEAIIAMSQLAEKTSFERSSIPTEMQLNLHTNGTEFYALMNRLELSEELLEKLAQAAHEVFCDELKEKGYKFGKRTNHGNKAHSSLRSYAELPESEKEQNRNNVRDIPNKLASIEYVLLPSRSGETTARFQNDEVEKLAKMEHERWMQQKLNEGWRYSELTDKENKLHEDLVPWDGLTESTREKDRAMVRGIPKILAKAGYTMFRL
jgi:hypothetical protein